MDGIDSLLSLSNLPFYMFITLLLSYFLWSKFLKNGCLKPENIDDLFDIIMIFVFVLFSLLTLLGVSHFVLNLLNLNIDLDKLQQDVVSIEQIIVILVILFLISSCRHSTQNKKNFQNIFLFLSEIILAAILFYMTSAIVAIFYSLRYVLEAQIFLVLYILILVIMILIYYMIYKSLFKLNIFEEFLHRKSWIFFLVAIILGILILLFMPVIKHKNPEILDYQIYHAGKDYNEIYQNLMVPVTVNTIGILGSSSSVIPIKFDKFNFYLNETGSNNFQILVNKSDERNLQILTQGVNEIQNYNKRQDKKYGINDIELDENKKVVIIRFDPSIMKNEKIKEFVIQGYVKKNISDLTFRYWDNTVYSDVCSRSECILEFNISNGESKPIHFKEETFLNLNNLQIENKTNCHFSDVISDFTLGNESRFNNLGCSKNDCDFEIFSFKAREAVFRSRFSISDGIVRLINLDILSPINVSSEVKISC